MVEVNEERRRLGHLVSALKAHLEWQKELGLEGVPPSPAVEKEEREGGPVALSSEAREILEAVEAELRGCTRCPLHGGRNNIVFGAGSNQADLMFIGEAPGAEEDQQGQPFVGRAGKLLTDIIRAMGFDRREVYITNIVKCRPPGNRDPHPDEIGCCEPFLSRQVAAIQPKVIVSLGRYASQTLLKATESSISSLRGRFHRYQEIPLMPTYHPSFLLRKRGEEQMGFKRLVWQDVQQVSNLLGRKTRG